MHSIHSMIQRFRDTKPTPRKERHILRKKGQLKEMWWVREERRVGEDNGKNDVDSTRDSLEAAQPAEDLPGKERWATLETALEGHDGRPASSRYSRAVVDKFMSEDIEHFLEAETRRKDRLARRDGAPRVLPSPSPGVISERQLHASWTSHPRNSLVPASDHETPVGKISTVSLRAEMDLPSLLRDSLGPDLPVYTGSAELRGDITTIPQEADVSAAVQSLAPSREEVTGADAPSAAGIASDLDTVICRLRSGVGQEKLLDYPEQPPRGNTPINLQQITHDLDAQLLEFTLMARAREQAAAEANKAEEAGKVAWRREETKKIEDMVRQENEILKHAAIGGDFGPRGYISGLPSSEILGHAPLSKDRSQWHRNWFEGLTTLHPPLPPSALREPIHPALEKNDAPLEALQMAEVIRVVEAKVKQIQALQADEYCTQDERRPGHSTGHTSDTLAVPANTFCSGDGSLAGICEERREGGDEKGIEGKYDSGHANGTSLASSARDREKLGTATEGTLTTEGESKAASVKRTAPDSEYGGWTGQENNTPPNEAIMFPVAMPQAWLYGKATLQQTGHCIGADLEVAMLCMQKRLGKEPIVYEDPDYSTGTEKQEDIVDVNEEQGLQEATGMLEGSDSAGRTGRDGLQGPTDGVAASEEYDTNFDLDRELCLTCTDDFVGYSGEGGGVTSGAFPYGTGAGVRYRSEGRLPGPSYPFETANVYSRAIGSPSRHRDADVEGGQGAHISTGAPPSFFEARSENAANLRPPPSAPVPQPEPQGSVRLFQPLIGIGSIGGSAPTGNRRRSTAHLEQSNGGWPPQDGPVDRSLHNAVSAQQQDWDHNGSGLGPGFAVDRARRRLQAIQKARRSMPTDSTVGQGPRESLCSTDVRMRTQNPSVEGGQLLSRLRSTRLRYSSPTPP